jgi:hypothetical protein
MSVEKQESWFGNIGSNIAKRFKPKPEANFYEPEPEPDPEIQETLSEPDPEIQEISSCPDKLIKRFEAIVDKYKHTHAKDFLTIKNFPRILYETNGTKYRYHKYIYSFDEDDEDDEGTVEHVYYINATEKEKKYPALMEYADATTIVRIISETINDPNFIDKLDDDSFANSFAEFVYALILLNPYNHAALEIKKPQKKLLQKMCQAYDYVKEGKQKVPPIPYKDIIRQIMGLEIKKTGGAKRKSKKRSKKNRKTKRRRHTRR